LSVVLDTNAAIYQLAGRLEFGLGEETFAVSVITQIELLSFPGLTGEDEAKIRTMLTHEVEVVPLTPAIVERTVQLRRAHRLKLPDAAIVATAMELGYELMTNDAQLARVPGVRWQRVDLKQS
jgi:predicted nucleic acid-binding protein